MKQTYGICSPCNAMYKKPTGEDKERLKVVLDKIFGRTEK